MKLTPADLLNDQTKTVERIAAESSFTLAGKSAQEAKKNMLAAQQIAQNMQSAVPSLIRGPGGSRNTEEPAKKG